MPEGDTLARIAAVLRGRTGRRKMTARTGPARTARTSRMVVGSTRGRVEARGKHLLIDFSNGLTLHTHLGMHGSWHRYRTGERWRRSAGRAVAVIETRVRSRCASMRRRCELIDTRAVALHPNGWPRSARTSLAGTSTSTRRSAGLRHPARARWPIGDALLDQTRAGRPRQRLSQRAVLHRASGPVRAGRRRSATRRCAG